MRIPFLQRKKKRNDGTADPTSFIRKKTVKKLVAGVVIGGAIASIVGKHLVEQKRKENGSDELENEE